MSYGFDMSEYLGIFLQEADEQLTTLEENLVKLEREGSAPDVLQEIFRAAHTLKGASASMGFTQLAEITHSLENVLDAMRNELLAPSSAIIDVLFRALDLMRELKQEVADGRQGTVSEDSVQALLTELKGVLAGSDATRRPTAPARPAEGGPQAVALNDTDYDTLRAAVNEGFTPYAVHVSLKPGCPLKGIRAALVVNALNQVGEVVKTVPPAEDLEEDRFDNDFVAVTVTTHAEQTLCDEVNRLSEIASVEARPIDLSGAPPQAGAGAPPAASAIGDEELVGDTAAPGATGRELEPAGGGAAAKAGQARQQAATVRVNVEQLDNLMNMVAELVIDRTMLEQIRANLAMRLGGQDEHVASLEEAVSGIRRRTTELQDEIMKARLLPIGNVFSRFPRMLRDLAQKAGKKVDFQVSGGETELDRSVLDFIADPLIHILRNSVDHGIETPEDRIDAGKPETGTVDLSARHEENHIVIDVVDDGRGIDPERVKAAAIKRGLLTEEAASRLNRREALELIFAPGTSTAEKITDVSGRGVGMDIVRTNIEKLNGSVDIHSEIGVGTTMRIRLPLTLAIIQALMVQSRGQFFAIPLSAVVETERRNLSTVSTVQGRQTIVVRERVIPLLSLAGSLRYVSDVGAKDQDENGMIYVVVVSVGERIAGLVVDRLIGEQEVVIKSLGKFIGEIRGISGATILGEGTVAQISDVGALLEMVVEDVQAAAV